MANTNDSTDGGVSMLDYFSQPAPGSTPAPKAPAALTVANPAAPAFQGGSMSDWLAYQDGLPKPAVEPKESTWDAIKRNTGEAWDIAKDPDGGILPAAGKVMSSVIPKSTGWLGDTTIDVARAPMALTQTLSGLGNLATGGLLGKGLDEIGYNPKAADAMLSDNYSPQRKKAQQEVDASVKEMDKGVGAAEGAADTTFAGIKGAGSLIGSLLSNPSVIQEQIIRTLPDMLFGAGVVGKIGKTIFLGAAEHAGVASARAVELMSGAAPASAAEQAAIAAGKKAIELAETKLSYLGHGIEGAQATGQNAWQIREDDPNSMAGQYLQIPAGVLTGLIGRLASKVPGFGDVQTATQMAIAGPNAANHVLGATGSLAKRIGKGVVSEGLLQEFPQSAQEQIWQNIAQGKPWNDGVLNQAVQGGVVGGVMGGVGGGITSPHVAEAKPDPLAEAAALPDSPLSRAALASQAGQQFQDLNITQPADDLAAQRAAYTDGSVPTDQATQGPADTSSATPDTSRLLDAQGNPIPTSVLDDVRDQQAAQRLQSAGQQWQDIKPIGDPSRASSDWSPPSEPSDSTPTPAAAGAVPLAQNLSTPESTDGQTTQAAQTVPAAAQESAQPSENRVASSDTTAGASAIADARTQIPAPKALAQAGIGVPARKAKLAELASTGFSTVERRADGFWLVNDAKRTEMRLSGGGDAQMARMAIQNYVKQQADTAAASPNNNRLLPTPAQIEAGNYKKSDVIHINGMRVVLENPAGSTRSGVSPEGKAWKTDMVHHYGEFVGTEGADGDRVDTFIGPRPDSNKVFVIDQTKPDGSFDEHKAMIGFTDIEAARKGYLANYEKGWTGLGSITEMSTDQFKAWAKSDLAKQPASVYAAQQTNGVQNDGRGTGTAQDAAVVLADHAAGPRDSATGAHDDGSIGGAGLRNTTPAQPGYVANSARDQAGDQAAVQELARRERRPSLQIADPSNPQTQALDRLFDVFAGLTGKRGIAIHDDAKGASDGIAMSPNFFVNIDKPQMHVAQTIGHEFKHLTERYPGLLKLYDRMWDLIPTSARQEYLQYLHATGQVSTDNYSMATAADLRLLKSEMLADFMGQRFNDKEWLTKLAKQKPALFESFVRDWIKLLGDLLREVNRLIGSASKSKDVDRLLLQYHDQLEEAKQIAMDVATAWAEKNPKLSSASRGVQHSARLNELGNFGLDNALNDADLDMFAFLNAQRDLDAKRAKAPAAKKDSVSDTDIQQHGIRAESSYPKQQWVEHPHQPSLLTATVRDLYHPGEVGQVTLEREANDLWGASMRSTWVGPADVEETGYVPQDAAERFVQRYVAGKRLQARGFDLTSTQTPEQLAKLVETWKSLDAQPGAHRYSEVDDASKTLKEMANDMGITQSYAIAINTNKPDPTSTEITISFMPVLGGEVQTAQLSLDRISGKWVGTAHTEGLTRGSVGAAFYQLIAEYAALKNFTIAADISLSGVNTYRRTEQMMNAALRTGKSNVMTPHDTQRIYGFEDDAKTPKQHDANVARLALAGLRNSLELAPELEHLTYHPETGAFEDVDGQSAEADVMQILARAEARAFGLGRSTLARAALTQQMLNGTLEKISSFKEPVLYSKRLDAELEYQAVVDQFKDTPQWMLAPNGLRTNLEERQWVQVRTPSFKEFFGDWEKFANEPSGVWSDAKGEVSKVVDKDTGEPLVVYHGTDKGGFYTFKKPGGEVRGDLGIFTTSNREMARSYLRKGRETGMTADRLTDDAEIKKLSIPLPNGSQWVLSMDGGKRQSYYETEALAAEALARMPDGNVSTVYATFMNLRNPAEESFEGALWSGSRDHQWMVEVDGEQQYAPDGVGYFATKEEAAELAQMFVDENDPNADAMDYVKAPEDHFLTTDDAVREGMKYDHDGTIIRDVVDDGGGSGGYTFEPSDVFVANDPSQLKSADFNTGEFGYSDDIRYSKKDQGLNPKVVAAVPGITKITQHLTASERAKLRTDTAQKLLDIHLALPSSDEVAAVAYAGKAKRGWYRHSKEGIDHIFGADGWRFTGLLAAMSPQCSVEVNLENALNTWKNWTAVGRPQTKAEIVAVMGRSVQGLKGEDGVLGAWINNSVRSLTAATKDDVTLSGPKVNSFYQNLIGNLDEVTNDAWMANYALIDQMLFSGNLNKAGDEPGKGAGYMAMNAKVRSAAKKLGWKPAEVQETVWSFSMSLLEMIDKQQESRGAIDLMNDGELSDEVIGKTKDFRILFREPRYATVLEAAGYTKQLDSLAAPVAHEDNGPAPFENAKMGKLLTQAGLRLEFLQRQRRTNVQMSWESRPGESTGLLPGIHSAPLELQQAHLADVFSAIAAAGFSEQTGLSLRNTLFGPSAWQGKVLAGAQSLTRPGVVADNKGGLMVDPESRAKIGLAANILGLVLSQEGVYWHYPVFKNGKPELDNGIEINFGRSLTNPEMARLYQIISKKAGHSDWAPANTPTGVRVLNFSNTPNKEFHKTIKLALAQFERKFDGKGSARTFSSDGEALENNWKENADGQDYLARISQAGRSDLLQWANGPLQAAVDSVNKRYSEQYGWGAPTRADVQHSARDAGGPGDRSDPSHGAEVRQAVHYGKQGGLSHLSGDSYGSGIKGAERIRLETATDKRIRRRVYFYLPIEGGIPQAEAGLGGHVYTADLSNLYDPLKSPERFPTDPNKFESAVLDAGYRGYISPEQGAIVMLDQDVPVKHIGMVGDYKVIQRKAERIIPKNETSSEGDELVRKPEPQELMGIVKQKAQIQAAAPSFRMEHGYARVKADEAPQADLAIEKAGSRFRFGVQHSARDPLGFYSELSDRIERSTMKQAPVDAWKSYIKALTQKGVKAEEIEWTGINDWLDLQEGKVGKDALLEYLDANGVKVQEVVLGGKNAIPKKLQEYVDFYGGDTTTTQGLLDIAVEAERDAQRSQRQGRTDKAEQHFEIAELANAQAEMGETGSQAPKYASYQLPGGTNYREVLLTLPPRSEPIARDRLTAQFRAKYGEAFIPQLTKAELKEWHVAYKNTTVDRASSLDYKSSHWDQPNVLAHIRLNDRTDAEGKKVLFVEEIQSDWAQQGKKEGFRPAVSTTQLRRTLEDEKSKKMAAMRDAPEDGSLRDRTLDEISAINDQLETLKRQEKNIPSAPFVGKTDAWVALAIRRIIKMAVDGGYDKVAFINGEQSADRYDLSKQISAIRYNKVGESYGVVAIGHSEARSSGIVFERTVTAGELPEIVGKEIAERIVKGEGKKGKTELNNGDVIDTKSFSGLDLKVGGEGMQAFYNQIVLNIAKDVLRKLGGGKMETVSIDTEMRMGEYYIHPRPEGDFALRSRINRTDAWSPNGVHPTREAAEKYMAELKGAPRKESEQPGFTITPALREKVSGGMPQYSKREIVGESRHYDARLRKAFANVGWEVEVPTLKERAKALWKDAGKKLAQGIADQFMPIKELSQEAYSLLRLAKGAAGAFETILQGGLLKLTGGVYDFNEAKRGGAVQRWLVPMQGEHHDMLRWVAANRAEGLMDKSESERTKGMAMLTEADQLSKQAKALEDKAKDYLQQAGNAPKSMTGNQGAQKANLKQANELSAQAKQLRSEAAEKRTRGNELKSTSLENLFTREDISAIKTLSDGDLKFDFKLQHGPKAGQTTRVRAEMFADSLETFNEFNRNVMDMAEQSGLIDGEARKMWEGEFYVPFYRVMADNAVTGGGMSGGAVRQQAFKRLKGGTDKLNSDLLDNTLMNWAHLLDAAAKNRAAKATLEAAEQAGVAITASEETARQMGKSVGNKNGVVWFMDEGKQRYFLVDDPYVLTAITSLEYAGMNSPMMKAMGAVKNMLTVGVTASPFFKVRNLIRDSIQVIGTGNIGYNPVKNVVDGWKLTNPENDIFFRLLAGGGTIHFGTMLEGSEAKRVQALVESGVDASTILGDEHKVKAFYRKFIEPGITAYNELGNRGEAINRAALYEQLVKQGVSHADASLQARDLMDFSMAGSFNTIRFLTQVVPFMNARIQGLYKLGKAAKEDPKRFAYVTAAVALASLALLAAYGDDDDWKKREDFDRDNWWWFKFGGTAFRIPKPFELGAIGTLAERSAELIFNDEMTASRFRGRVLSLLGDNLSMNPIPQLVKPMLDVYANTNSFTGRPIESMGMDKLQAEYRFTSGTSMAARGASTAMNAVTGLLGKEALSPVQIDSLIQGYFGWLGAFAVGNTDMLARYVTDQPTRPAPDIWKTVTGGMLTKLDDAPSRYVSQVYTQARVMEEAYGTWRALQKEGKSVEAAEFQASNAESIQAYRNVEAIKGAIAKINQQLRIIERSDMDPDAKRIETNRLNALKDKFARRLV